MKNNGKELKDFLQKMNNIGYSLEEGLPEDMKVFEDYINSLLAENININLPRIMNADEKRIITKEGFDFLKSLVQDHRIKYHQFEKVLNILVKYKDEISEPIETFVLSSLLEMMTYTNFQDQMIDQIIQLYINSPEIILNVKYNIH